MNKTKNRSKTVYPVFERFLPSLRLSRLFLADTVFAGLKSVLARQHTDLILEQATEILLVHITDLLGNPGDALRRIAQIFLGPLHPDFPQVFRVSLAGDFLKALTEITGAHMDHLGDFTRS